MKKKKKTDKEISGKDRLKRTEKAYQEWRTGKVGSLQKLAKKYRLHVPDISKYITHKFELAKIQKENERTGAKFNT